jgi:hydroxyacylglutathione hydrolase
MSGWAPEVVTPPGGDLPALLASIERIQRERFERLAPAHGPVIHDPAPFLRDCLEDACRRERRIASLVSEHGPTSAWRLATRLSPALRGAGMADAHAILAHLARLAARGDLVSTAPLGLFAPFAARLPQTLDRYPLGISGRDAAAG